MVIKLFNFLEHLTINISEQINMSHYEFFYYVNESKIIFRMRKKHIKPEAAFCVKVWELEEFSPKKNSLFVSNVR